MARRTVAQIAAEAGLDLDEALVTLWDAGIESVLRPDDPVPPSRVEDARSALGLATKEELTSLHYWTNRLDLTDAELRNLLREAGVPATPGARKVPKGGVAVLRRFERSIDGVQPTRTSDEASSPARRLEPPFAWNNVGKIRPLSYLSDVDVIRIHEQLFEDFRNSSDPIDTPGVRSANLLSSACSRPQTGQAGHLKYPTAEMAAAALAHSLVHNHPFWNGNKRTALVSFLVALEQNGLVVTCDDDDLFRFILRVAQHRLVPRDWSQFADREVLAMAEWTRSHSRSIRHGERPIKWHKFRRILSEHGCTCEQAKNVGNRMNITREIQVPGRFGIGRRTKPLHAQVAYGDEGREVDRDAIRYVRRKLQLDEEHGVDSGAFYEGEPITAGEFIRKYQGILRRLARL